MRDSEPGAPLGQSGTALGKSFGNWAKAGAAVRRTVIVTGINRMTSPERVLHNLMRQFADASSVGYVADAASVRKTVYLSFEFANAVLAASWKPFRTSEASELGKFARCTVRM